jgi:hypothetical protein
MERADRMRTISRSFLRLHICFGSSCYILAIYYLIGMPGINTAGMLDSIILEAMVGAAFVATLLGLSAMATATHEDAGTIWLAVSIITSLLVVCLAPATFQ